MSYIERTFDCEVCGKPTTRKRHPYDPMRCVECGNDLAAENSRQLVAKRGPHYEKWLASMRKVYADPN